MNRKFFALLFVLLAASCAFGEISQELAASDPRIAPHIGFTKQNGASRLPGRYMLTQEVQLFGGEGKIHAPSEAIVEFGPFDEEHKAFPVNLDMDGDLIPMFWEFDTSGKVPLLKAYELANEGQLNHVFDNFAVLMADNEKHLWLLGDVSEGKIAYMYPLVEAWFPAGWLNGSWKRSDGAVYTFAPDGKASVNGESIGKFRVSDNRIILTHDDGTKETLYATLTDDKSKLVITFKNDGESIAAILERAGAAPVKKPSSPTMKPSAPMTSPQKPAETPSTQMPSQFPKMPDVKMPVPPAPSLNGVWGAYVNGQQWVMQYQGNNYYGWINGQPSEMGIFQFDGEVIRGQSNAGVNFIAEVDLDASGQTMTLTFANGNSITYQKLQ